MGKSEFEHAVRHWRQHFRGDARIRQAAEITNDEVASSNLVLFGTPTTNSYLAKIVKRLPMTWSDKELSIGKKSFAGESHMPILIYPNPENPERYVVLNSGFTYREYAYLNNARQVPMLPDWAVVDVRSPATSQYPGKIVSADFFDERWQVKQ